MAESTNNPNAQPKLTRNERKRRYKEAQAKATDIATASSAVQTNYATKRQHRMPPSAFLPLAPESANLIVHRRCVIEYDGSQFNGFQAQDQLETMRTVQETIEDALFRTTGEQLRIRAASRTDRGVHACGQVIVFSSRCITDDSVFRDALNNRLPEDILCRKMQQVAADFDPRTHSNGKIYSYTIVNGGLRPVLDRHRVWHVKKPLDLEKMKQAIAFFLAPPIAKDYSSFTPQKPSNEDGEKGNVCSLTSIELKVSNAQTSQGYDEEISHDNDDDGIRICIVLKGNRFLYKMVRNLVGTLVDVGLGRLAPDAIPEILEAKDRAKAGQGAPPQGLTLVAVKCE